MKHLRGSIALIAALALTGCGPKAGDTAAGGAESAAPAPPAGGWFSGPKASYKATYEMNVGPTGKMGMVVYASGGKVRSENGMLAAATGRTIVSLMDPAAKEFLTFQTGPGAPKTATKLSSDDLKKAPSFTPDPNWKPTKVGTDTVAGLGCTIWEMPATDADHPGMRMCITDDGIMLRTGTAEKPMLTATEVLKGPQDAALFALPAGYTVIDMGDCMGIMQHYAEAMKNGGPKPDPAKMKECQTKMMQGIGAP